MARGNEAKNFVINKIAAAFGSAYLGEFDKKLYVEVPEGGEKVQIAIALTCPKNPIVIDQDASAANNEPLNFEDMPIAKTTASAVITPEETQNIATLLERLGL